MSSYDSTDISAKLYLSSIGTYPYPQIPPVASVLSRQIFPVKKFRKNQNSKFEDSLLLSDEQKNIFEKNNGTASVELWWNPALPTKSQPSFLFEYCLVVSERRHYRDNCLPYNTNVCFRV